MEKSFKQNNFFLLLRMPLFLNKTQTMNAAYIYQYFISWYLWLFETFSIWIYIKTLTALMRLQFLHAINFLWINNIKQYRKYGNLLYFSKSIWTFCSAFVVIRSHFLRLLLLRSSCLYYSYINYNYN